MEINCPACGAQAPARLKYSKLLACPHCKTTLFLEDETVKNAGGKSSLVEVPSILSLGRLFTYRNWMFEPYGRIQFDYGDGLWDEWWVILTTGGGKWISVDEGEISIETAVEINDQLPAYNTLSVGQQLDLGDSIKDLRVTEKNDAVCTGLEGELPEVISPGEKHQYAHLSGSKGLLLTLEYSGDEIRLFKGVWVDPFEIIAS